MQTRQRLLYASPNGDRWHLVRATDGGDVFVRHTANEASGGHVTDVAIPVFLGHDRHGPEHQELRRLIGDLVADVETVSAGGVDAVLEPGAPAAEPTPGGAAL
ncbi:hypothetical protein [uncultured Methylobacterium sp.]|uniref:hypothetical protein n=1 Tax=uncultured Methylobacterium sp. TaxID=157278 RepID=UPI0035CB86CB